MTTDSVLDFLDGRTLAGCRNSTVSRYGQVLNRLAEETGCDPLSLSQRQLRDFLNGWSDSRSHNGAAFLLRHMRTFYRWAVEERLIEADPCAGLVLRAEAEPMTTATDEQMSALVGFKGRTPKDVRDRAMLHVLLATGARRSEIGSLTVNDVMPDDCLIRVRKSKTVARLVPITDEAVIHLRRWLRVRPVKSGNLWCSADGPALVGRVVARRSGGALTPHSIRRWFATTWLSRGGSELSLSRILGWSSTAMAAVYTRATAQQVTEAEYARLFVSAASQRHLR